MLALVIGDNVYDHGGSLMNQEKIVVDQNRRSSRQNKIKALILSLGSAIN